MLKVLCFSLVAAITMTGFASAEQSPVGLKSDVRIKRYVYDENNVYKLDLYLKSVTALQFAEGENVESVLIGDSASWEVVKLKMGNVISIKPIIDSALTNMTVYTDQRVYTFEIRSLGEIRPGVRAGANQSFRAIFTYPKKLKTIDTGLAKGGPIYQHYLVSGEAQFRPLSVSDNMQQTIFILPKGVPRPAIFKVGHDREEKLVNSRTNGDRIIVDGTSDYWVMRIGDESICVARASTLGMTRRFKRGVSLVR